MQKPEKIKTTLVKKRKRTKPAKKNDDVATTSKNKRFIGRRLAGRHRWSLDDAVIRERTAFGRTICALESGDAVNEGYHPESIPLLLWNDSDTAPLEILQRSHEKNKIEQKSEKSGADRSLYTRLQTIDERWYIRQSQSESTDMEVIRRKRGVARQTAISGVSTFYIPPGIESVMPGAFQSTKKKLVFAYGSEHAAPENSSNRLKLEQTVVMRGNAGNTLLRTRAKTILRELRNSSKDGFMLRDFMTQLREKARAKLVYAVFKPIQVNTKSDLSGFQLGLSFSLNRQGRYFGQFLFSQCLFTKSADRTKFGERRWLSSMIPHGSRVQYICHACACTINRE